MPLEKTITNSILRSAKRRGWWCYKVPGTGFGVIGLPDIHLELFGSSLWLEVKQPGKSPTRSQVLRMKEIERVGGSPCHVVTSKEEADAILDFYEKHFSRSQEHKDMGADFPRHVRGRP